MRPRIQSYLLALGGRALSSPLADELLTRYVPLAEKELVIHTYELGFSRRATEYRLTLGSVHPVREVARAAVESRAVTDSVLRRIDQRIPVAPPLHLWRPLFEDGFPFVKRQLLRDGIASVEDLRPFVPERTLRLAVADIERRARGM